MATEQQQLIEWLERQIAVGYNNMTDSVEVAWHYMRDNTLDKGYYAAGRPFDDDFQVLLDDLKAGHALALDVTRRFAAEATKHALLGAGT